MVLDSLLELVGTLRERISEHGALLGQNEMRTRYALIDPLLRELGWDTSNPSEVVVEDSSGGGRADYLLLVDDAPVMVIEAKRLGLGVKDGRKQAVNYAMDSGRKARYFTVTDGNQWEIYDTHKPAINMVVTSFGLQYDIPSEVRLKVSVLWRSSVSEGIVSAGQVPSNETVADEWYQLSGLDPDTGTKPAEILFPDGSSTRRKSWATVTVAIVQWLLDNNILRNDHYPIEMKTHRGPRCIINDRPFHSDGKPFRKRRRQIGHLYLETDDLPVIQILDTVKIIESTGQAIPIQSPPALIP